mgnify:CR=1 FL=1|jgi:hypothetical protein
MWSFVVFIALLIPLIAVVLDSQLGRALAARLERPSAPLDPALSDRVAALEAEVERLSGELRSLAEQSEFLQRLLEEKPAPGGALPSGEPRD